MKYRRFEKLCLIAAKKNWCANINCGTCGHQEFRRAWPLLVRGYEPGTRAWVQASKLLGNPPPDPDSELDQDALSRVLADTRLKVIGRGCRGANHWLMYLGLSLYATERIEAKHRRVTRAWVPQLLRMIEPQDVFWLERHVDSEKSLYSALDRVAAALLPQYRPGAGGATGVYLESDEVGPEPR